ncbi:hypothetical protein O1611_g4762 [Lasiodiplodia mahajangana]|uniref:Uncharacterized protein n=1 Tax=Lasiodiplodia mahajangana TaxID=1108764 RepID=A0ACC2JMZ0_9PEZI|nr:hypothetical protein O1611_g4762 [Lasiodiplodia mahajangana]
MSSAQPYLTATATLITSLVNGEWTDNVCCGLCGMYCVNHEDWHCHILADHFGSVQNTTFVHYTTNQHATTLPSESFYTSHPALHVGLNSGNIGNSGFGSDSFGSSGPSNIVFGGGNFGNGSLGNSSFGNGNISNVGHTGAQNQAPYLSNHVTPLNQGYYEGHSALFPGANIVNDGQAAPSNATSYPTHSHQGSTKLDVSEDMYLWESGNPHRIFMMRPV